MEALLSTTPHNYKDMKIQLSGNNARPASETAPAYLYNHNH